MTTEAPEIVAVPDSVEEAGTANTVPRASASARFDKVVLASGKVSQDDLRKIRKFASEKGERVDRMLVELGFMSEDDLLPVMAEFHGVRLVDDIGVIRDWP